MNKKMKKRLRKEAEREAQARLRELRTPRKVSLGTARTAIVAGLGEGAAWLGIRAGSVGKLMYE